MSKSDDFVKALERLIRKHGIEYADDSFGMTIKGVDYNVEFRMETASEKTEPTHNSLPELVQHMMDHPGKWKPADDPGSMLKGFVREIPGDGGEGEWITAPLFHKVSKLSKDQTAFLNGVMKRWRAEHELQRKREKEACS